MFFFIYVYISFYELNNVLYKIIIEIYKYTPVSSVQV